MAFEAVFENASVAFNSASGAPLTLTLKDQKSTEMTVEQPGPKESTTGEGNISSLGGYFNELEYFTNCLKANKAPEIATVRQASDSLRVVLAELKSAQTETSVTL
jgi:predicted dehydrogenase